MAQNPEKSAYLKTITVRKLEEVTKEAMSAWFNDKEKPKNAEKRVFLRDIFRVATMDERYRRGELGMLHVWDYIVRKDPPNRPRCNSNDPYPPRLPHRPQPLR